MMETHTNPQTIPPTMARATTTRLQRYGGNRHCIYLRSDFVTDSAFPFAPGDRLVATIHDDHVTLHKE